MPVSSWDLVPANNNAASPNGWPEGMQPSGVNDTGRQMMADIRAFYDSSVAADASNASSISTLSTTVTTLSNTVTALQAESLEAVKTATESSSSTSFQSDDHLTLSLAANTYYAIDLLLFVSSGTLNGTVSFQTLASQANQLDCVWSHAFLTDGSNETQGGGQAGASTTSVTFTTAITTLLGAIVHARIFILTNASNAPTYTLQWKVSGSSASVNKGSYMIARKVG